MAVGVVAEDDPGHVVEGKRPHPDLDGVILPLGVAGQEDRVHQPRLVVDRVLLQVRVPSSSPTAHASRWQIALAHGPSGTPAVRQVMVFLDRAVELADRPRQPAGREPREVVPEELGRATGEAPRDEREELHQPTQRS